MVIHSGSLLLPLAYLITLMTAVGLLVASGILVARKFRLAGTVAAASLGTLLCFFVVASLVGWGSSQRVIKLGDSYCWDLWCMGVDQVSATPRGSEVVYKIDVHFFSDANTVKTGLDDARIYLVDDRSRRFPLVDDPGAIPITTRLDPRQTLNTSLTFVTPADARELFLTGDAPLPSQIPLAWKLFLKFYADLHIGYEKILHKPTVLRVL